MKEEDLINLIKQQAKGIDYKLTTTDDLRVSGVSGSAGFTVSFDAIDDVVEVMVDGCVPVFTFQLMKVPEVEKFKRFIADIFLGKVVYKSRFVYSSISVGDISNIDIDLTNWLTRKYVSYE